jgi:predicted PurR-regulated permease PerM
MVDDASGPGSPGPNASDRASTTSGSSEVVPSGADARSVAAPVTPVPAGPVEAAPLVRILPLPGPSQRAVLMIGAAIVLGIALWMGREAIAPFVVGLLIVYLLDPLVERIARFGLPRWLAILLVYVVGIILIIELFALTLGPLVAQVTEFIKDFPRLSAAFSEQLDQLGQIYRGLSLPPELRESIDSALGDLGASLGGLAPGLVMPVFGSVAGFVSSLFGYIVVPVWVFYILRDRPGLSTAFDRALPPEWREDVWALIRIVRRVFSQWIRGQLFLGVTVGVATFIGLLILGAVVDPVFSRFALFLAIVAGLLELLPIIGPIIAAVPAVLLAATVGLNAVIAALALYLIVQQVENTVLVPKIQGDAVELHPSLVIFALVIGGATAGLLGAILSLPLTAAARNIYRYLYRRLEPNPEPPAVAARGLDGGREAPSDTTDVPAGRPAATA